MRPRSRLSKRRLLLPTIREGTEETVRDLNEANALHTAGHGQAVSSEDYLLSICHLAHPTFSTRDVCADNTHNQRPSRLSRLGGTATTISEEARAVDTQQREEEELNGELTFGLSDPLEYLYGHQNNLSGGAGRAFVKERFIRRHGSVWEGQARSRAHSIPRTSSPDLPRQRKSSCPELHISDDTSAPSMSPKHSFSRSEARRGSPPETKSPTVKQSLISQWISDCRSAWREARVRACMLPAIAEI